MGLEAAYERTMVTGLQVSLLHSGDVELIRPGATAHGVGISENYLFEGMSWGAYNIRLPKGDEYEARRLENVRGLAKFCIDYRQSAQVASVVEREGLIPWTDAGGAAQPERSVLDVDMQFWDAVLAINPDITASLFVHLEVCGGANHYTRGKIKQLREDGPSHERKAMTDYLRVYERELRKLSRSMPIKKGLVEIGSNNLYSKIAWL